MKWSRTLWSFPPSLLPAFLLWKNLSQKISLIREWEHAETKENSQRRSNDNNVVIKHSRGPLFNSFSRVTAEKAMAPHSSTPAWKIPWTQEPGRLQSMGSLRVRHYWETSLSLSTFMHRRRKWQPTPVFLPGESQGWGSLVGCRLWDRTESDTTEAT